MHAFLDLGVEGAGLPAGSMVPGLGLPIFIGEEVSRSKAQTAMQEDRGRVALGAKALIQSQDAARRASSGSGRTRKSAWASA